MSAPLKSFAQVSAAYWCQRGIREHDKGHESKNSLARHLSTLPPHDDRPRSAHGHLLTAHLTICGRRSRYPEGPASYGTKVQYSLAVDSDYDSVMASVLEILAARLGGLCLECVLTKTGLRADQALRQIDAMPMRVTDGRCGGCAAAGPVFAHAPGGSSG